MFDRDFTKAAVQVGSQSFRNMPVDFTTYLLSASPPGFDYYNLRDQINADLRLGGRSPHLDPGVSGVTVIRAGEPGKSRRTGSTESLSALEDQLNCMSFVGKMPETGMGKKKVSFADELGYALTKVKIILETPDQPPRLSPELIASLTQGAKAGVTEAPALKLNFKQPAADYLAFRTKLEKNCVCLENVVVKDYTIYGTIKVKNLSFEKTLTVRFTMDSWRSSSDVLCKYVSVAGSSDLDTFSFELNVPTNFDPRDKVEFCICYETASQQFWDNNEGLNYGISSCDPQEEEAGTKGDVFSLDAYGKTDWATYSSWMSLDSSVPYW